MLQNLLQRLRGKPKKIWGMWKHKDWGDQMNWNSFKRLSVVGWLTPMPEVGDELQAHIMKTYKKDGRTEAVIVRYKFVDVSPCGNPSDMFFATVKKIREWRDGDGQV